MLLVIGHLSNSVTNPTENPIYWLHYQGFGCHLEWVALLEW